MYQIISKSIYGISIIDECKDLRDAQILAMRYSCDYGQEFLFKIKKGRKILFTYWDGINGNLLQTTTKQFLKTVKNKKK